MLQIDKNPKSHGLLDREAKLTLNIIIQKKRLLSTHPMFITCG
jgi:hypothetical protein